MASEGLSRRGFLTASAAGVLAAAAPAVLLAPDAAEAQQVTRASNSNLTTVYGTFLDAGGDAADFSNARNTIGVVIGYGPDVDPMEVGNAFAQELLRRGVNARSFAAPTTSRGASVLYQIGPSGLGPLGVNTAAANMSRAVELSRARDRVISSSYTPNASGG